jgi:hypothetical protein
MARGKQAASAAIRRLEMAMEHIDRLTEQLAEAKIRVKSVEKEAARVPGMERELTELRGVVAGEHEHRLKAEVEDLRDRLRLQAEEHEQDMATARRIIVKNLRVVDLKSGSRLTQSMQDWDGLAKALGTNARDLLFDIQNVPKSFAKGPTGPEAFERAERRTRVLTYTPLSRETWADNLMRCLLNFFDDPTDARWDAIVTTIKTVIHDVDANLVVREPQGPSIDAPRY